MLIIFNLIYCTYGGRGRRRGRRGPSLCPSHSFSTAICLCLPPPSPPPPLDVVLFFIGLFPPPPPSLSNPSAPPPPSPLQPLSLALSWASVQLNLYTLCTHNQPNENPTANTLSAGWSASVLRRVGVQRGVGPGGGMGTGSENVRWLLFCSPGRWLGWSHLYLLCPAV